MNNKYYLFFIIFSFAFNTSYSQTLLGIDVSHHQGTINWTNVYNDGKVFAFVKATEGFTYDDPEFISNMNNGTAAQVVMGAYHFARPDNNSAVNEANHFVGVAGSYIGQGFLPPVLDLEDPNTSYHLTQHFSSSQLTNWVQTWLTRVENLTGVRPIIYTNSNLAGYLENSINSYDLWIAKPDDDPDSIPSNLGVWTTWKFKQYSWHGSVNGIAGEVDLNSFHGTVSDFQTLIGTNSIQNNQISGLKVYPNPTDDVVYFESENNDFKSLKIFDINGRILNNYKIINQSIDIKNLDKGLYLLNIEDQKGSIAIVKIVKR